MSDDETTPEMLARLGTDAMLWAQEFNKTAVKLGYSEMDEGWLIGWFANAIENCDVIRCNQLRAELDALGASLRREAKYRGIAEFQAETAEAKLAAVTEERDRMLISAEIDGGLADECRSCGCQHESWKAHYAAVTAERDRMREALKPFARAVGDYRTSAPDHYTVDGDQFTLGQLRRARAALEGVTEPAR